jgi:chromosome segregation ATPase
MAETLEQQINRLKSGIERARSLRDKATSRKEVLLEQQKKIREEIAALGVDPDKLEDEIARLEGEARSLAVQAEGLIPWDLLGVEGK